MKLELKNHIVKTDADLKAMSEEQLIEMNQKNAEIDAFNLKTLGEFIQKSTEDANELKTALKTQSDLVGELTKVKADDISVKIKEKEEAILNAVKSFKDNGKGQLSLDVKTVTSASVVDSTANQRVQGIGHAPVRRIFLQDVFRNIPVTEGYNGGKISYVEQDTLTRNADNVASCVAIPESDITWIEKSIEIKKIGTFVKLCQDALEDYAFMDAEIEQFVLETIKLKVDEQLLLGTGVTTQMNGIDSLAQTWSVGVGSPIEGLATSIKTPTMLDVILTGKTQIMNSMKNNSNFASPNYVIMNPTDSRLMSLEKDANGQYLLPNYLTVDGIQVEGMIVIESPLVVENTLYIMDSTKGAIYTTREIELMLSTENGTDFVSDLATLKGTVRKNLLVKNQDANAFLKVDSISLAKTALTQA